MNSLSGPLDPLPPAASLPDYYGRAVVLWPRLACARIARVRHDPYRMASIVARRTTLSYRSILELLGADPAEAEPASRDR